MMLRALLAFALCAGGCFYVGQETLDDLARIPSRNWTSRECLTIIASGNENNYLDFKTNIKISATLYAPSVIAAINRRAKSLQGWSEAEYRRRTEELTHGSLGLFVDWEKEALIDPS